MAEIVVPRSSTCTGAMLGERAHLLHLGQAAPGREATDPPLVREVGEHDLPTAAGPLEHVVQRRRVADLLDREDVRRHVGDPVAQGGDLRAVGPLVVRAEGRRAGKRFSRFQVASSTAEREP